MTITINRPSKLNALNTKTLEELMELFNSLSEEKELRGIILTGAEEKAFVAGADISEFKELNELNARKFAEHGQEVFDLIEESPVPVVAVVSGFALGGGCELAMACHMRIATENAKFGQPEVNLGLIPGYGGTQRLTNLIGRGKAIEYMMTGEMISSQDGLALGLVNYVLTTKNDCIEKTRELLGKISEKAPVAIEMVISSVNAATNPEVNGYQIEANSFAKCCGTDDFREGAAAFLEKRKPNFKGS